VRGSRRALQALLTMTEVFGRAENSVILRRPRSGRLEGRKTSALSACLEER
jgi:hypothetical protein